MAGEIAALGPVILLAVLGFVLPMMGAYKLQRGPLAVITLVGLALAGLLVAAWVFPIPGLGYVQDALASLPQKNGVPIVYGVFEITPFAAFFDIVFLSVAAMVVIASPDAMRARHQGEYYGLLTLATLGMFVVAGSRDLITLFVGFEIASLCTFVLAGYYKNSEHSTEASMKFFIIGALSSALTLFGISIIYGLTKSVSFDAIAAYMGSVATDGKTIADIVLEGGFALWVFAWGFLLAGFGFKIALVPFHNWAPDVYQGSPTPVSAFLAAGSKKVAFVAIFKLFLVALIAIKANWMWVAGIIAIVTMTVGNLAALSQTNVKRMLAYSSIAQAGYMLIALPVATQLAVAGGLYYILAHAFMKAGAFLVVAAVATVGIGELINDWRGLGKRAPYLAFAMAVFMISFAGIPPLAGFAGKFFLFGAAIQAGDWFIWLAVAGIINSAISLYYYARVVRAMYVDEPEIGQSTTPVRVGTPIMIAIGIGLAGTILLGVWPGPVYEFSLDAAKSVLASVSP